MRRCCCHFCPILSCPEMLAISGWWCSHDEVSIPQNLDTTRLSLMDPCAIRRESSRLKVLPGVQLGLCAFSISVFVHLGETSFPAKRTPVAYQNRPAPCDMSAQANETLSPSICVPSPRGTSHHPDHGMLIGCYKESLTLGSGLHISQEIELSIERVCPTSHQPHIICRVGQLICFGAGNPCAAPH